MPYDDILNKLLELEGEWISFDEKLDGVEELLSLEELLMENPDPIV